MELLKKVKGLQNKEDIINRKVTLILIKVLERVKMQGIFEFGLNPFSFEAEKANIQRQGKTETSERDEPQ